MNGPIYEHARVNGKPTGLYALAGQCVQGKFVKATRPSGLKTVQQWEALASRPQLRTTGLAQEHPTMRWRCSYCLAYLKDELDATGQYPSCPQCGHSEERAPEYVPEDDKYIMSYAAPPDTLSRVVELQRARAQGLPLPPPAPVQLLRLPPPTPRTIQPFLGNTLDRVVARQRQLSQREPDLYAKLRTHEVKPCQRCGKADASQCPCPPAPPSVLDAVAAKRKLQTEQQEASYRLAGYPDIPSTASKRAI